MKKASNNDVLRKRVAAKSAARVRDRVRLENGEVSPEQLQRENSSLAPSFFAKAKILNLSSAVGR
jgi:hypothetical protein